MFQFSCRFAFLSTFRLSNWTPKNFCQMPSKSIFITLSYTVSKLMRFSETQCIVLTCLPSSSILQAKRSRCLTAPSTTALSRSFAVDQLMYLTSGTFS